MLLGRIFVLPVLCLLSASGAIDIYQRGYHFIKRCFLIKVSRFFNIKHIYVFCVMIIVFGISGSCLQDYYRLEKSSRREISINVDTTMEAKYGYLDYAALGRSVLFVLSYITRTS